MTTRSQRPKTQIRQDLAEIASDDRIERSATAANSAKATELLLADLQAISRRSAAWLQGQAAMTKANLYNEDGLPA
jgi:hypothetical protein